MNNDAIRKKSWFLFFILLVSLITIVVIVFKAKEGITFEKNETIKIWPFILGLMCIMFMAIGWSVSRENRLLGVLINERNSMSLSRFQMALWTLIILSSYATIVLWRSGADDVGIDVLEVIIPPEILILMGINTAALVGSPMLESNKMKKIPTEEELANKERAGMGILSVQKDENEASLTDLFRGDEIKNWNYVDMPRLQMFFFTIIVAIIYCVEIYRMTHGEITDKSVDLPTINEGMVTLMGISNAAYLGGKAVDQTPSEPKQKQKEKEKEKTSGGD